MIPKFFGQYLLEKRIISSEGLSRAIEYQEAQKQKIGELAVKEKFMTEEQVKQVIAEQKSSDKYFGEICVDKGFLDEKQIKQLIVIQKNSHVYLGEALVKTGVLSQEEVDKQLDNFHLDQKDVKNLKVEIPVKHSYQDYLKYFIDLLVKMFMRVANIEVKIGKIELREKQTDSYHYSAIIEFSEDINLRFFLNLSEQVGGKIAAEFLGENIQDEEIIAENTGEFLNVVCGNIATKLQMLGLKTQISVPRIIRGNEVPLIPYKKGEKGVVFPLITPEGLCEAQIVLKGVEANVSNKKTILIVDDSKSVAYKLRKIIEKLTDFEVVEHAKDGNEALEMYRKFEPDLVTMDIVLPDKSGLEVIKDIKSEFPDANIVVISSVGGGQDKLFEAIQAGAKNVIVKPFDEDTVREIFIQSV